LLLVAGTPATPKMVRPIWFDVVVICLESFQAIRPLGGAVV
jgi:hypothetical protein